MSSTITKPLSYVLVYIRDRTLSFKSFAILRLPFHQYGYKVLCLRKAAFKIRNFWIGSWVTDTHMIRAEQTEIAAVKSRRGFLGLVSISSSISSPPHFPLHRKQQNTIPTSGIKKALMSEMEVRIVTGRFSEITWKEEDSMIKSELSVNNIASNLANQGELTLQTRKLIFTNLVPRSQSVRPSRGRSG